MSSGPTSTRAFCRWTISILSNPRVMLDTNIVSHIMRFPEQAPALRLPGFETGEVVISSVVLAELRFGAVRIRSERLHRQIDFVLQFLVTMPFDDAAAESYAEIRTELERRGRPIGPNDIFIAAHALSLGLPLVTANLAEFSRVPNLVVENWLD
jgi:tRNA(fMet)-specific endonuclease VapC